MTAVKSNSNQHAGAQQIDVWLIEDNEPYRRTLARTINRVQEIQCSKTFTAAEPALTSLSESHHPDLILLDIGLPGMNGITALSHLRAAAPSTKIVILTVFDDHDRIFGAVCAGANGYLLKNASAEEIARAIKEVHQGGASMTPQVARKVLELMTSKPASTVDAGLTARETDVLAQIVRGLTKEEIAAFLNVSPHTVDTHMRNIYQKLHVHNRAGAVAAAIRQGLV